MALKALAPGVLTKTFFDRNTSIKEGDPLAIMVCDPENGPRDAATCELTIIEHIRPSRPENSEPS